MEGSRGTWGAGLGRAAMGCVWGGGLRREARGGGLRRSVGDVGGGLRPGGVGDVGGVG